MNRKKIIVYFDTKKEPNKLVRLLSNEEKFELIKQINIKQADINSVFEFKDTGNHLNIFYFESTSFEDFYKFFRSINLSKNHQIAILISDSVNVNMMNYLIVRGFKSFLSVNYDEEQLLGAIHCSHQKCIFIDSFYGKKVEKVLKERNKFRVDPDVAVVDFSVKNNLNNRESDIISLLYHYKSYDEIASTLFISINTVRFHIKNIYSKFNVHSRQELIDLIIEYAQKSQ